MTHISTVSQNLLYSHREPTARPPQHREARHQATVTDPVHLLLTIILSLDRLGLAWERVEKLGGKFLQLRLEDLARTKALICR
jgi:hypothetical protein